MATVRPVPETVYVSQNRDAERLAPGENPQSERDEDDADEEFEGARDAVRDV